jgi:chemotaxis protein CheD
MVHVVGLGEMQLSDHPGDVIVTHPAGSCVGVSLHDPQAGLGGILHFILPSSEVDPDKAAENPYLFADTGIPAFFHEAFARGASRTRMRVVLVGGMRPADQRNDLFAIGRRNQITARKLLWREELLIGAEHVSGARGGTFCLEVGSGRTWMTHNGTEVEL